MRSDRETFILAGIVIAWLASNTGMLWLSIKLLNVMITRCSRISKFVGRAVLTTPPDFDTATVRIQRPTFEPLGGKGAPDPPPIPMPSFDWRVGIVFSVALAQFVIGMIGFGPVQIRDLMMTKNAGTAMVKYPIGIAVLGVFVESLIYWVIIRISYSRSLLLAVTTRALVLLLLAIFAIILIPALPYLE